MHANLLKRGSTWRQAGGHRVVSDALVIIKITKYILNRLGVCQL